MTGVVGALVEAWGELRTHKLRVLLALIGVAVAVTAITGMTAALSMLQQAMHEQNDRQNGRQTMLTLNAWPQSGMTTADAALLDAQLPVLLDRYDITRSTRQSYTAVTTRFPDGTQDVQTRVVDPGFAVLYRQTLTAGRWFTADDERAYAPVAVVNQAFLDRVGGDLGAHPTALLGSGAQPVRATVVGVVPDGYFDAQPEMFLLTAQVQRWSTEGSAQLVSPDYGPLNPGMSVWVPTGQSRALSKAMQRDLQSALPTWQIDWESNADYGTQGLDTAAKWIGFGVGAFALLLGGLGLLNIALVTVRYRIREIGIRRSFGATSGRVFFSVMLESVVATVVAGVVGVGLAIVVAKNIPIDRLLGQPLEDVPGFPVQAAVVGMLAACAIGALAGLIPAVFAVRVKVIDAIRY